MAVIDMATAKNNWKPNTGTKPRRREVTHHERHHDADEADDDDGPAVAAQVPVELELEPDLEHQEYQADLGEPGKDGARGGMEQPAHEFRKENPEEAGPE